MLVWMRTTTRPTNRKRERERETADGRPNGSPLEELPGLFTFFTPSSIGAVRWLAAGGRPPLRSVCSSAMGCCGAGQSLDLARLCDDRRLCAASLRPLCSNSHQLYSNSTPTLPPTTAPGGGKCVRLVARQCTKSTWASWRQILQCARRQHCRCIHLASRRQARQVAS